jgi:hypothetical protein
LINHGELGGAGPYRARLGRRPLVIDRVRPAEPAVVDVLEPVDRVGRSFRLGKARLDRMQRTGFGSGVFVAEMVVGRAVPVRQDGMPRHAVASARRWLPIRTIGGSSRDSSPTLGGFPCSGGATRLRPLSWCCQRYVQAALICCNS